MACEGGMRYGRSKFGVIRKERKLGSGSCEGGDGTTALTVLTAWNLRGTSLYTRS